MTIKYICGHCKKENPENINYRGEVNCCASCLKDLHYKIVEKETGISITVTLTKKSALEYYNSPYAACPKNKMKIIKV